MTTPNGLNLSSDESPATSSQAARILATDEALNQWKTVVTSIVRRARGLKPEDEVELPDGNVGKYVKYAFDNKGRLSLGKGHGRRKVRGKAHVRTERRELVGLAQTLFQAYISSSFKEAQLKHAQAIEQAKADGASEEDIKAIQFPSIDAETFKKANAFAIRRSADIYMSRQRKERKAARKRQQASRRINFGLVPGNAIRLAHSAA